MGVTGLSARGTSDGEAMLEDPSPAELGAASRDSWSSQSSPFAFYLFCFFNFAPFSFLFPHEHELESLPDRVLWSLLIWEAGWTVPPCLT